MQGAEAAAWQARLTAAFFDPSAKHEAIREVREGVARLAPGLSGDALEALQRAVVGRLVGAASRDARPPARVDAAAAPVLGGEELENRVIARYPYPVAVPYRKVTEQESAAAAFGCLLDTFESLVHFLGLVVVGAYFRGRLASAACNRHLLERLLKSPWSTGDLLALLRDTVRLAGDCEGHLPYAELPAYLFTDRGKPTASSAVLDSFVTLRNRAWGHGAGREEAFYADILPANRLRLEQELARMTWLDGWDLIRPLVLADEGRVVSADILMGERRLKGRAFDLALDPADLDRNGGTVRAEKSVLLVAPDRGRYLPLFPLSLFHFQLRSQGLYFLQRPHWEQTPGGRQLRKACYVAYEARLEEHEESPGDLAVRLLEEHVRRLEAGLSADGRPPEPAPSPPAPAEDPDCELAEVRQEQRLHLGGFVGRDGLLADLAAWVDRPGEGGYLLLLGPPGQGKSALLAELARREAARGGCLLHMVKSHRNPLKFVPSLLTQAARLAQVCFGAQSYRGDLDDLRNALLRALEAVRERTGRAVLVVDALDELEQGAERIRFLPESVPAGVRVVLTSRPDIPLVRALRVRLRALEERPVPPLSDDDLPAFLAQRFPGEAGEALRRRVDWSALFRRLQGNPLFLRRALDQVARAGVDGAPLHLEDLPETLADLFQDIYGEIAEKAGTRYTSAEGRHKARLLHLLCLAREPLTFGQLAELMTAEGTPLSLEDCRDRVCEMSDYLLESGSGRFQPWHQGLADYVTRDVLGEAGCRQAHEVYAAWLRRDGAVRSPYGLRHRVAHLLAAGRAEEAAELLLHGWEFLEAKAAAGLVFDLAGDFAAVQTGLPADHARAPALRLLTEAVRADIHFLARHPDCLFQCLWNRAWWYDCPEAARHYDPPEGGWPAQGPPWQDGPGLSALLESWHRAREQAQPGGRWLRSLRPPPDALGAAQLAVFRGHEHRVYCLAVSADGGRLASGSGDATVRLWDAESGAPLACLRGHDSAVACVAFAPDGTRLASGSRDGTVRFWDVESGALLARLPNHGRAVEALAFSPEGRRLVTGAADRSVRLWDARDGRHLATLRGHEGWVSDVTFAPDGRLLASASADRTIRLWDAGTGTQSACLRGHGREVGGLAFSPDGRRLASASWDGTVRLWDVTAGRELACLTDQPTEVRAVAFSPDGRHLASGSTDRTVRVWGADGRLLSCFRGHENEVTCVAFSADGRRLFSGSRDETVRVWDAAARGRPACLHGHADKIHAVGFAADGRRLVTGSRDRTVRVWDAATGIELACLRGHGAGVLTVAVTAEGARVASGDEAGMVRLWDADACAELAGLSGHDGRVQALAFSPDCRRLASGSRDRTVRLWDVGRAAPLACLAGHTGYVESVTFSPDGLLVASASRDRTIRVWDATSGQPLVSLDGHAGTVLSVDFSPDGRRLISGSKDGTVRVWGVDAWRCLDVIEGRKAARVLASGRQRGDWHAVSGALEVAVVSVATRAAAAWLPAEVHCLTPHPAGRAWAGAGGRHLYLFTLEGAE
jgi:WD40 repeat protein